MAQVKKGLGRGLSALIPTDMDFLAEVARGDFSVLAPLQGLPAKPDAANAPAVSRETASKPVQQPGLEAVEESTQTSGSLAQSTPQVLAAVPTLASTGDPTLPTDTGQPEFALGQAAGRDSGLSARPGRRDAVLWVAPDQIVANPYQPRRSFDEAELSNLAGSIREHGVLQPIIVRPLFMGWDFELDAEPTGGKLQLIAGERRWRAAQAAGLERVPVIVREVSDQQALELAIIENVQRHDISALDAAIAYKRLAQEFGLSQERIAQRVGKSRPSIANTLRLLDLPPEAQQAIQDGTLSEGHGRAILLAPGAGARRAALRAILRGKLSVRQAEEIAGRIARQSQREAQAQTEAPGAEHTVNTEGGTPSTVNRIGPLVEDSTEQEVPEHEDADLQERLQRALSCRVEVRRRRAGGQIVLFASDAEQLERLAAVLSSK